jgi:putative ABC transport system permease protein
MIYESIKMVFKVFKTNKMRTFLTMLGIIIGIFSITVIFTISSATQDSLKNQLSFLTDSTMINVSITGTYDEESGKYLINIPSSEMQKLSENENIESVTETFSTDYAELNKLLDTDTSMWYSYGCASVDDVYFANIFKTYSYTYGIEMIEGRTFTKMDSENKMPFCIISTEIASIVFGRTEDVVGETITMNDTEFKIIGLYTATEEYIERTAFVLTSYVKEHWEAQDENYVINITSTDVREEVTELVNEKLQEYLNSNEYYIDQDYSSYEDEINSIFGVIELIFGGIAGLSLLVGGIGIMNIMLVSVNERIKEIGIRMALGANSGNIKLQFLIESVMITILSGILGMLLAALVAFGANKFIANSQFADSGLKFVINFQTAFKTTIFCGIIGIVFGVYPANKASKLNPVDALRYE